jgi:SSS family solute:Na+ symporter
LPAWTNGGFPDFPFLDRMSITFVLIIVVMIVVSLLKPEKDNSKKLIEIDVSMFRVSPGFAIGSGIIIVILTFLYTVFW